MTWYAIRCTRPTPFIPVHLYRPCYTQTAFCSWVYLECVGHFQVEGAEYLDNGLTVYSSVAAVYYNADTRLGASFNC